MTDLDPNGLEAAGEAAWMLWDGDDDTGVWDFIQTAMPHAVRAYLAASAPSPSELEPRPWPIAPDTELPPRRKPKVSEWTCCGVTFSATDEFIGGARSAHRCSATSPSPPDTDERLIDAAYDRRGTSDE